MHGDPVPPDPDILAGLETFPLPLHDEIESIPTLQGAPNQSASEPVEEGPHTCDIVKTLYEGPRDKYGHTWVEEYPIGLVPKAKKCECAITLHYKNNRDELAEKPMSLQFILVSSAELKDTLRLALHGYPGIAEDLIKCTFWPPFAPFAHRWDALQEILTTLPSGRTCEELENFCQALRGEWGDKPSLFRELLKHNVVTFDFLDYLFTPGLPSLSPESRTANKL